MTKKKNWHSMNATIIIEEAKNSGRVRKNTRKNENYSKLVSSLLNESSPFSLSSSAQLDLPRFCSRYHIPPSCCTAFLVPNLLSSAECQFLIQFAEKQSNFKYITEAKHFAPDGSSYLVPIYNPNPHKLSVFYGPQIATAIWNRLHPVIAKRNIQGFQDRNNCGDPVGLNPRIRILRYDADSNDRFEPHFDATTFIDSHQSLLTVLIYLNDGDGTDFLGGETCYLDSHISSSLGASTFAEKKITKVTAESGKAVIFEHDLYHSGAPLTNGTKYVLRTDVMFPRKDKNGNAIADVESRTKDTEDKAINSTTKSSSPTYLVIDLLRSLHVLTTEEMSNLESACILDMTITNLFAIGTPSVRIILQDSGLSENVVDRFVLAGAEILRSNSN